MNAGKQGHEEQPRSRSSIRSLGIIKITSQIQNHNISRRGNVNLPGPWFRTCQSSLDLLHCRSTESREARAEEGTKGFESRCASEIPNDLS